MHAVNTQLLTMLITGRYAKHVRSFSYLQIIMICMKTRRSLKFGHIRLPTAELAALECLKNPHRLIMGKHFFSAIVYQILFIFVSRF